MKPIKQYIKAKKSEISENILLYLNFTQHQTLIPKILGKKKDTTAHFCVIVSITLLTVLILLVQILDSRRQFVLIG